MAEANPAGTMFLGLVDELMDLVKNPDVSGIEVVMAGYELDKDGEKLISGKHSIAQRAFKIRGMNKDVQEKLREQFDAGPINYLMILWTERFQNESKMGILTFDPVTRQKRERGAFDYDNVERSAISDYLKLQKK